MQVWFQETDGETQLFNIHSRWHATYVVNNTSDEASSINLKPVSNSFSRQTLNRQNQQNKIPDRWGKG